MRKLSTYLVAVATLAIVFAPVAPVLAQGLFLTGAGSVKASAPSAGVPTLSGATSVTNNACSFLTTCPVGTITVPPGFIAASGVVANPGTGGTITGINVCSTPLTIEASTTATAGGVAVALFSGTTSGGSCPITITYSVAGTINSAGVAIEGISNLTSTTPGTGCAGAYQPGIGGAYQCTGGLTVSAGGFGMVAFGDAFSSAGAATSSNSTIDSQSFAGTPGGIDAVLVGIAHTTVSNTPDFSDNGFLPAAIVGAPWR